MLPLCAEGSLANGAGESRHVVLRGVALRAASVRPTTLQERGRRGHCCSADGWGGGGGGGGGMGLHGTAYTAMMPSRRA